MRSDDISEGRLVNKKASQHKLIEEKQQINKVQIQSLVSIEEIDSCDMSEGRHLNKQDFDSPEQKVKS